MLAKKFLRSRTKMLVALLLGLFAASPVDAQGTECQSWQVWNGAECVAQEPQSCSGSTPYSYGGSCYASCPSGTYTYSSDCVSTCPSGTQPENGNCVVSGGTGCSAYTYNGECVAACPTGTYYYNTICYDSCPTNTVVSGDNCIDECPYGSYMQNGQCVTGCRWTFNGECRDECWKSGYYIKFPDSNECVTSCPNVYEMKNNTCLDACAPGQKLVGTGCVDTCPSQMPYANGDRCDTSCPKFRDTSTYTCVDSCTPEQKIFGNACYDQCPSPMPFVNGNQCSMSCPVYVDTTTYNCVDRCPDGTVLNEKRCEKPTCNTTQYLDATNTCRDIPPCSSTQYLGSDYTCYDYPSNNSTVCTGNQYVAPDNTCKDIPSCSSTQYLDSDGTCYNYTSNTNTTTCSGNQYIGPDGLCREYPICKIWYEGRCVDECPAGTLQEYSNCVKECSSYTFHNGSSCVSFCDTGHGYNGTCVSKCPSTAPLDLHGKCVDKCPEHYVEDTFGRCDCTGVWFEGTCTSSCPPTLFLVDQTYCSDYCPPTHERNEQNCTYKNPCPPRHYQDSNGTCVSFPGATCEKDQWFFNNTCIPACKDGEFLDLNGKCNDPQALCKESLPGAYYNTTTHICGCPDGFWITRSTDKENPMQCEQASVRNPPHINCRSFIPYTVYVEELETCLCDPEHPIVIPNPTDSYLPFSCAVPGTETTIRPCERGSYFDFLKGECVKGDFVQPTASPNPKPSMTPMPTREVVTIDVEVSKTPMSTPTQTMTALPSRRPSQSASLTRTPKPSNRPGSPSSTISASRTPRPSAAIFADITRKPLPSIKPLPPPPVAKSPAPSPWAKKTDFVLAAEEKPAYIDAKVSVAGANKTEMVKPEKIQEMQASLACTLRMPLENILITNITYVDEKGIAQKLDVDPTKFMMAGDGSTDCYDMKKPVQTQRLRRVLQAQQQQQGTIEVDYAVIAPSDDILSMDISQMQEVLSTSPIMVQVVQSVGGSAIKASAPEAASAAAAAPSASASPTSSSSQSGFVLDMRAAIGGGIAGIAVLAMFVTLGIFYVKEKKRNARLQKEKLEAEAKAAATATAKAQPVMLVFQGEQQQMRMNPIQTGLGVLRAANSMRFDAVPETTRRSVQPLKATHGSADWATRSGIGV